jgi:glycosyltransferase involved in cell wall biosynthesis
MSHASGGDLAVRFDGLRLGLVGPVPPPAGGMAMQTQQLAGRLTAAGAQVTLVATNAPYRPTWVGRIPVVRALARLVPYLAALWRASSSTDVLHVMANSGWSWHLFAAPAIWIAWLRAVPVIVNYRGGEAREFLASQSALVRMTMARTRALCVPSDFLREVFAAHDMRAQVVPNVVDTVRFRPSGEDDAPSGVGAAHIFVARNLEPIYDNETALRALAIVRESRADATMTIAGTGPQRESLQLLARELGLSDHVRFAGRMVHDEVAATLRSSAVALNPSRVDNMPNSVLEALASGVPVVSTRVGGVPYIVRDGCTALLVPAGDPQAMAAALLRVLDDKALALSLRAAGVVEAARYTWARVAPLWLEQYRAATQTGVPGSEACTRD